MHGTSGCHCGSVDADDHFGCTAAPQSLQSNKYFGTIKKTPESVALVTLGQRAAMECLAMRKVRTLEKFMYVKNIVYSCFDVLRLCSTIKKM